jgi:hypothetical protein
MQPDAFGHHHGEQRDHQVQRHFDAHHGGNALGTSTDSPGAPFLCFRKKIVGLMDSSPTIANSVTLAKVPSSFAWQGLTGWLKIPDLSFKIAIFGIG